MFQRKILICREYRVRNSKAKRFRKRDERAVLHEPIRVEPKTRTCNGRLGILDIMIRVVIHQLKFIAAVF